MDLIKKLFDIKINNNYISKEIVYDNLLDKIIKRFGENRIQEYTIFVNQFHQIKLYDDKYKVNDILNFMKTFLYLPIHYTYLKELNLVNSNFDYIKKKFEYQCGYFIYKEFKLNNTNYNVFYQHQIYLYKIDYVIQVKNTNILIGIEIDEKHHLTQDETERTICIELSGIPLIRIPVHTLKDYTEIDNNFITPYLKQIHYTLKNEIDRKQLFNETILFNEAKKNLIEEDFARITGMSIINNDFTIPGDYIIKYIDYDRRINMFIKDHVTDELLENVDYIKLSKEEYFKQFAGTEKSRKLYNINNKDRRKEYYLFNVNGMNLSIIDVRTPKAKEVKRKIVKMYEITRNLLQNKILNEQKETYIKNSKINYILDKLNNYKYNNKIQRENTKLREENKDIINNQVLIIEKNKIIIEEQSEIIKKFTNILHKVKENNKLLFNDVILLANSNENLSIHNQQLTKEIKYYENNDISSTIDIAHKFVKLENMLKKIYSVESDKKAFENLMKSKNIDNKFYKILGKSLENDDSYSIHIDDIANYVEYSSSRELIRTLIRNNFEQIYYKEYSDKQYMSILAEDKSPAYITPRVYNKRHLLFTRIGFYKCLSLLTKPKAKKSMIWFINIYEISLSYLKLMKK